jgi:hypothetical protein
MEDAVKGDQHHHPPPDVLVDFAEGAVVDIVWREHIARCGHCSAEVEDLKRTLALVSHVEVPEPGAEYWNGFGSRLKERVRRKERIGRPMGRWLWPAAVAAILVAAIWIGKDWIPSPPPDTVDTVLPPAEEDPEFQLLLSMAEIVHDEEDWEEKLGFSAHPDLDPTQFTAEEQELLRLELERDLEGGNHAIS